MNFKHRRPRRARSGCKLCKPWKCRGNISKYNDRQRDEQAMLDRRRRRGEE